MIEILPNWHPIFVHFTVSLFTISVIFYLLSYLFSSRNSRDKKLFLEFEVVARWCLWVAAVITIFTVAAGFYAYYTVKHDGVSHAVMTTHRNWALPTASAIFLAAIWSTWRYYKNKRLNGIFIIVLLVVQGLLLTTAWFGAELVFRYGVGVMSLPQAEALFHHHNEMAEPVKMPTPKDQKPHRHAE